VDAERDERWLRLGVIALVEVLVMSLWFSASAVVPQLAARWHLSGGDASWLTTSVQLGFVAGAVASAVLNLPDMLEPRRLIAGAAVMGAAANAAFALVAGGLASGIPLRFLTGVALAGVYPPGMQLVSTWFRGSRGLAVGTVVGALVLGSGSPHLVNALPAVSWRGVLIASSVMALAGAALAAAAATAGPGIAARPPFRPSYVLHMAHDRRQRLVSLGYFGHMWELYAWWTWLPAFVTASFAACTGGRPSRGAVEATSFAAIGIAGLAGCLVAGVAGDRRGRAETTITAMAVSGTCCLLAAVAYGHRPVLVAAFLLVWGAAVVADSAQFSTALTEVTDTAYVGTALTAQTAIGFAITVVSIRLMPTVTAAVSWRYAFCALAAGPALGILAMVRVRSSLHA
jgi:MFS family permease